MIKEEYNYLSPTDPQTTETKKTILQNLSPNIIKPIFKQLLNITLILVGISIFISGFVIGKMISSNDKTQIVKESPPTPTNTPVITRTPTAQPEDYIPFLVGKEYLEDQLIIITKDQPRYIIHVTISRVEQESDYIQHTRLYLFDTENWYQEILTNRIPNASVNANLLIREWDPVGTSLIDKSENKIVIFHKNKIYYLSLSQVKNEVSMISLKDYTKFIYQGEGTLTIDGRKHEIFSMYSRSYTDNAYNFSFLNQPYKQLKSSVVFWDNNGNFYLIDVLGPQNSYSAFRNKTIVVKDIPDGGSIRSFDGNINSNKENTAFTLRLDKPINQTFQAYLVNRHLKQFERKYSWMLGELETITLSNNKEQQIKGFGIIEIIKTID